MTVNNDRIRTVAVLCLVIHLGAKAHVVQKPASFDHNRKEHKLVCNSCHSRPDNQPKPRFPAHQACINCHISDFTVAGSRLCDVCHQIPLNEQASVLAFPAKLKQLGLSSFSHQDHLNPAKMPKDTKLPVCLDCHHFDTRTVGARFPSHPECYRCHEHQPAQKRAECNSCHSLIETSLPYSKQPGIATTEYSFVHAKHFKAVTIKLDCSKCHKVTRLAKGTLQPDLDKMSPVRDRQAHNSACWQAGCHVTQKEISCKKCHVRPPVTIGQ